MSVRVTRESDDRMRIEAHQAFWSRASGIAAVVLLGGMWNKWAELDQASVVGMGLTVAAFLGAAWFFSERRRVILDRAIGRATIERRRFPFGGRHLTLPLNAIAGVRRDWGPTDPTEPRTVRPVLVLDPASAGAVAAATIPLLPAFETRDDDFDGIIAEIEDFLTA